MCFPSYPASHLRKLICPGKTTLGKKEKRSSLVYLLFFFVFLKSKLFLDMVWHGDGGHCARSKQLAGLSRATLRHCCYQSLMLQNHNMNFPTDAGMAMT